MFWENFLSNLASGIALRIFGKKKKEDAKQNQGDNKQKNKTGQNIVQNIGIQHVNYYYNQYFQDSTKIPSRPIGDTSVTGTVHEFGATDEEMDLAADEWIQNQIDQERGK